MADNSQKTVMWGFMLCRLINLFRRFAVTLELIYHTARCKNIEILKQRRINTMTFRRVGQGISGPQILNTLARRNADPSLGSPQTKCALLV